MNEQEFRDLLDEYSRESGFDLHVVQKRWAFLAAKKYAELEIDELIPYTGHLVSCNTNGSLGDCSCGLDDILS